jgi:AbrB family looped-hinge helix DNA binding protein
LREAKVLKALKLGCAQMKTDARLTYRVMESIIFPYSGMPEIGKEQHMNMVKLGKKGQVSIPRSVLRKVGITDETPLLVETTDDGAIILRQAVVYPIEVYSDERIAEFLEADKLPAAEAQALKKALVKKKAA